MKTGASGDALLVVSETRLTELRAQLRAATDPESIRQAAAEIMRYLQEEEKRKACSDPDITNRLFSLHFDESNQSSIVKPRPLSTERSTKQRKEAYT